MDIRIGSLNCLNLSKHSELKKDISLIARIIIRERFDVVALQEVKNGGLDTILTSLNGNNKKGKWAGCADRLFFCCYTTISICTLAISDCFR